MNAVNTLPHIPKPTNSPARNATPAPTPTPPPPPSPAAGGTVERRLERRASVDVLLNRFIDGYPYLCVARDVSRSGMRLRPLHEPRLRESPRFMGLQFQLPGIADVLTASVEAVFAPGSARASADRQGGEIGVRFTRLPQAARDSIDAYLKTSGSNQENSQNETSDTTST